MLHMLTIMLFYLTYTLRFILKGWLRLGLGGLGLGLRLGCLLDLLGRRVKVEEEAR